MAIITPLTELQLVRFYTNLTDITATPDVLIQQLLLDNETIPNKLKRVYTVCALLMDNVASSVQWDSISMGGISMSQSSAKDRANYFRKLVATCPSIHGNDKNKPLIEQDNTFYHNGDTFIQR